jgi:hypothetical protein
MMRIFSPAINLARLRVEFAGLSAKVSDLQRFLSCYISKPMHSGRRDQQGVGDFDRPCKDTHAQESL